MKKLFVRTFGCKTNQYESQLIKELAVKSGYLLVEDYKSADVIIVNSCCVTQSAERDVYKFIRRVARDSDIFKKRTLLIGCYAEYIKQNSLYSDFYLRLAIPINVEFVDNKNKYTCVDSSCQKEYISSFFGHTRAYVKIQDGCNNFCSYCIVPFLRSNIYSKPKKLVIDEIENLRKNGFNEIVLVGTNIGKYSDVTNGHNYDLVDLATEILQNVDVKLIFSSLEPVDINDKFFSLIEKYKDKIFPHFHISLQSADDYILECMNRKYTAQECKDKIMILKKIFPGVIISVDLIVGYPEETKERFNNTLNFIKTLNLNWIHVFPYSPRIGTLSYKKYKNFVPYDTKSRVREILQLNCVLGEKYYKQICKVI